MYTISIDKNFDPENQVRVYTCSVDLSFREEDKISVRSMTKGVKKYGAQLDGNIMRVMFMNKNHIKSDKDWEICWTSNFQKVVEDARKEVKKYYKTKFKDDWQDYTKMFEIRMGELLAGSMGTPGEHLCYAFDINSHGAVQCLANYRQILNYKPHRTVGNVAIEALGVALFIPVMTWFLGKTDNANYNRTMQYIFMNENIGVYLSTLGPMDSVRSCEEMERAAELVDAHGLIELNEKILELM